MITRLTDVLQQTYDNKDITHDSLIKALISLEHNNLTENTDVITIVKHIAYLSKWLERFNVYLINTYNYGHLTDSGEHLLYSYSDELQRYTTATETPHNPIPLSTD